MRPCGNDSPIAGRRIARVAVLVDAPLPPGRFEAPWNGDDDAGRRAASGVYFCRLDAGSFTATRRILFLK